MAIHKIRGAEITYDINGFQHYGKGEYVVDDYTTDKDELAKQPAGVGSTAVDLASGKIYILGSEWSEYKGVSVLQ